MLQPLMHCLSFVLCQSSAPSSLKLYFLVKPRRGSLLSLLPFYVNISFSMLSKSWQPTRRLISLQASLIGCATSQQSYTPCRFLAAEAASDAQPGASTSGQQLPNKLLMRDFIQNSLYHPVIQHVFILSSDCSIWLTDTITWCCRRQKVILTIKRQLWETSVIQSIIGAFTVPKNGERW